MQADLSDLAEVLTWCKTHDAECKAIVGNAERLYERLMSKEGQLDYLQLMTFHIAKRCVPFAVTSPGVSLGVWVRVVSCKIVVYVRA